MSNKKIIFNNKVKNIDPDNITESEDIINQKLDMFADMYVKKGTANTDINTLKEETNFEQKPGIKRTTLYLPRELHTELKVTSTRKEMSMGDIVVEALRRYFKS